MNVLGQVVGSLKPKNQKVAQGILTHFSEGQGHISHLLPKSIPSCMTVHDSVTVAAIVSDILPFQYFPLNVSMSQKVGQVTLNYSDATLPLDLPICQIRSLYLTS